LVQIFWPEKQMGGKIARLLRTFACNASRGWAGLRALLGPQDHAPFHHWQE